jgi:pimeloyl-ACP methyl ester carboxylesterase
MTNRSRLQRVWLRKLAARVMLRTSVGYVAASYTASRWLTRRAPVKLTQTPSDFGLDWSPLKCKTEDGIRLSGWTVEPEQPRGTVALFHGLRGSRLRMLPRLAFLAQSGFRCVSFDHRAHGKSKGRRTSFGYYEARDVVAIRRFIQEHWPDQPIAAMGCSMGAAALCYAAEQVHDWQALILEGLYAEVESAFQRRIGSSYPAWFLTLYPGIVRITERRLRVRMHDLAPFRRISKFSPIPVLFIAGCEDTFAPPTDAERCRASYSGPHDFWVVPDAGHSDMWEKGGPEYQRRVQEFLAKWMG